MTMRVTGMYSGLDTETIIQELVKAKQTKVDEAVKAQTKIEWQQEAWSELNTKVKSLYTGSLSNLRYESSYNMKTTEASQSGVVDVVTGDSAMLSVQTLKVNKLAKTGYLTGSKIATAEGDKVTSGTLLTDLGIAAGSSFTITVGGKEKTITVDESTTIDKLTTQLSSAGVNVNFDSTNQRFYISATESGAEADFSFSSADDDGAAALEALGLTGGDSYKVDGQDAEIVLNGVTYTSSDNSFVINGLTLTCKSETDGKEITLTTKVDTSGIYDMIKNFITEYSTLINEMDKLYNADSASDYEPLTDEEKESMTESEIEKWEAKIKESLLRRDSNLSTISSAFKEIMASGYDVNGTTMYLFDFGIETAGYFTAADNEKNAYHIYGDADDSTYASESNKLQAMIASDPDTVMGFFTQLSKALYSKITDLTKSVTNYRSYGNIYDDVKLQSDYDNYTTTISELEEKLTDYEDKWYSKFAAMETALAKLESNSNAVTSLLGL